MVDHSGSDFWLVVTSERRKLAVRAELALHCLQLKDVEHDPRRTDLRFSLRLVHLFAQYELKRCIHFIESRFGGPDEIFRSIDRHCQFDDPPCQNVALQPSAAGHDGRSFVAWLSSVNGAGRAVPIGRHSEVPHHHYETFNFSRSIGVMSKVSFDPAGEIGLGDITSSII